jgi:hypothetical protein
MADTETGSAGGAPDEGGEATKAQKEGLLAKVAERGEEAVKRLGEEVDKNERLHEARVRLEDAGRTLLRQLNLAPRDEVEKLRKEVELLQKRLDVMESAAARQSGRPPGTEE